jgi:hypothetical protein
MAQKKPVDPKQAKKEAYASFSNRRQSDGFQDEARVPTSKAWRAFVGEHGQRLRAFLGSFALAASSQYAPGAANSLPFVRDVLRQLNLPLPDLVPARLCEWFVSPQGGSPFGWRELTPGLAQIVANDGRAAVVLGASADVENLAAVVFPDAAANAANPTVIMVSDGFLLDPGTVLQGFRGSPCRYFGIG